MGTVGNTVVDEAQEEIGEAIGNAAPLLEGLRDYQRLNLKPATMVVINEAIVHHERRLTLLQAADAANAALLADGYPEVPVHEVSAAVYEDLAENNRTIDAALAHFSTPDPASTLNPAVVKVEPK